MRKLAMIVAALAFSGSAFAANMAVKAPPAPVATPYSWTGLYVGASVGDGWGTSVQYFTGIGGGTTGNFKIRGVVGGGTAGYNLQFSPNWVAGIEADWSGGHIKGSTGNSATYVCGTVCDDAVDWFGTVRGRLGYVIGNALLYGTGGFAYGSIHTDFIGVVNSVITTQERTGWTAGGGVEYAFNKNWSAKVEYLYVDFSDFVWTNSLGCAGINCTTNDKFNVVRLGLNYKFGGP